MTLNDKQNNTPISPSIGGGWYQTLIPTKSTKGEDIWYKIKLSCSVLIKKISSLLSVDYYKSNSENQFKDIQLQLHATDPDPDPEPDAPDDLRTSVSNPYTFNIQGNKSFNAPDIYEEHYDINVWGSQPWYNDTSWPDVSKVSDLTINSSNTEAKFNVTNLTDASAMFRSCSKLTGVDLSNFYADNVTSMSNMFESCSSLTSVTFYNIRTSNHLTNMSRMFTGCTKLATLDLTEIDTSSVTNMSNMFRYCVSLASLDLFYNTSNATSMVGMFYGCSSLTTLDLRGFDTSKVTDMGGMFAGCSSLTTLDLSSFDTSKVTNMSGVFSSCTALQTLYYSLAGFVANGVAPNFASCSKLETLYLYETTPAYVDSFITKAKVPSSCNVVPLTYI